jgi:NitT/TauT family transport system permease protein
VGDTGDAKGALRPGQGAQAGLGARLLTGSYYGQTVQIWSALVMSALLGLTLTAAMAALETAVLGPRRRA